MREKHILQQRIESANAKGRQALIPFVTAGFPTMDRFRTALRELDAAGADIIEIGIPFSDPVADGPVVENASRRVLEHGISLAEIMREMAAIAPRLSAGLVFMGYYNPFLQYGLEKLAREAAQIGVRGFIVPDLPLEESAAFRKALMPHGIALIALVGPNTPDTRLAEYARISEGYVYVVSIMGTTGARKGLPPEAEETVRKAKQAFGIPVALGFGLSHPDQLAALQTQPDALVFGSALLTHLDQGGSAAEFMRVWRRQP